MERQVRVVARYHYKHDYYVEVSREDSVIANKDYWLCRHGSPKKLYMFSAPCTDTQTEEHRILTEIPEAIRAYESSGSAVRYA